MPHSRRDSLLTWLRGQPNCQVLLVRQKVSAGLGTKRVIPDISSSLGPQHEAELMQPQCACPLLLPLPLQTSAC